MSNRSDTGSTSNDGAVQGECVILFRCGGILTSLSRTAGHVKDRTSATLATKTPARFSFGWSDLLREWPVLAQTFLCNYPF